MKIHRFIGPFDTKSESQVLTDQEVVHQIVNVLKLGKGEQIIVGNGNGILSRCTISGHEKGKVFLENCKAEKVATESTAPVVLCLSLLKKDNFELAVQKAVEVGVESVIPLSTERTVKQGFVRPRLEKIMKEASEQSGRAFVPTLEEPISLDSALFGANRKGTVIFCDGGSEYGSPSSVKVKGTSYVFVGPEGGWTDAEREMAREIGATFVSLAPTTLRAETAAILASYLFTSYPQS
ncbi:MAG: RsmE family RNA methyltransferase [Patescibacteria group bacterium]